MRSAWDRNLLRQAVTVVGAVAQAALPLVLLPRVRRELQPPDVIQPAPYAFAIWLPTYLVSLGYAGYQARPTRRDQDLLVSVGWPLAGAFLSGSVWAPLVYFRRYWAAQAALFGIAGFSEVARRRVMRAAREGGMSPTESWVVTPPAVLLSGWGAAATGVNLAAMLADGSAALGRRPVALGVTALLGLGAYGAYAERAAGGAGTTAGAGYAATLLWALAGIVVGQRRRSRPVALAASVAAAQVIAAAVRRHPPAPH